MSVSMCIVGCGEQATKVLQGLGSLIDNVDLYFASERPEDAGRYSSAYGGEGVFDDWRDAATDPRVDSMYLATPHDAHLEQTLHAVRHSRHVLVEKPIATTVSGAQQMVRAAREAGVTLMVSEPVRYLPAVDLCKQLVAEGAIGDVKLVQVQNEHYSVPVGWRLDRVLRGGGHLVDGGIHSLDILLNLGGTPRRVYAAEPRKVFLESGGEDGVVVTAHFSGGVVGVLNVSEGTPTTTLRQWVAVTGSRGQIRFAPSDSSIDVDTAEGVRKVEVQARETSLQRMMREFWSCVAGEGSPLMSGEEGMKDLAVVEAAYESLKRGDQVAVAGA